MFLGSANNKFESFSLGLNCFVIWEVLALLGLGLARFGLALAGAWLGLGLAFAAAAAAAAAVVVAAVDVVDRVCVWV